MLVLMVDELWECCFVLWLLLLVIVTPRLWRIMDNNVMSGVQPECLSYVRAYPSRLDSLKGFFQGLRQHARLAQGGHEIRIS